MCKLVYHNQLAECLFKHLFKQSTVLTDTIISEMTDSYKTDSVIKADRMDQRGKQGRPKGKKDVKGQGTEQKRVGWALGRPSIYSALGKSLYTIVLHRSSKS